jgi:PPK2 family polyphosphate:nucleotide phosphotransferase
MKRMDFTIVPGEKVRLEDFDPGNTGPFENKEDALEKLEKDIRTLSDLQGTLYAQNRYALLLIFQAMDAAGKDSVIKHVMSGVNPQGCQVTSFKAPSAEELNHDYLWRCVVRVPERGKIGIFNRSYYEEVLIVRVHPELLEKEHLTGELAGEDLWTHRYEEINQYERYLTRNGIYPLKFFLHVSREEQRKRFLKRLEEKDKNWKFSMDDIATRGEWDQYMEAYEAMVNQTSTPWAPWHVIPADHKWFTRVAVADLIVTKLRSLDLRFPELTKDQRKELQSAQRLLENEGR